MIPEVLTLQVQEEEPICGPMIQCLAVLSGQHILTLGYVRSLVDTFEEMRAYLQADVLDFERDRKKVRAVITDKGRIEATGPL